MLVYSCIKWGVMGYYRGKEWATQHRKIELRKTFKDLENELKERNKNNE